MVVKNQIPGSVISAEVDSRSQIEFELQSTIFLHGLLDHVYEKISGHYNDESEK
jgi:hypothetical protein